MSIKSFPFLIWFFFACFFCLPATNSFGKILFQDNFDSHPDWSPTQSTQSGIVCQAPCSTAPNGYDAYKIQNSNYSSAGHNTLNINSNVYRGPSGKSFVFWSEVCDSCGWASDGLLSIRLNAVGYEALYARFYIKFQPNWKWGSGESPMQKFFKFTHYDGHGDIFKFFGDGFHGPIMSPKLAKFQGGLSDLAMHLGYRFENVYYPYNAKPPHPGVNDSYFGTGKYSGTGTDFGDPGMPGDGEWHAWEFYVKINSAIGVPDGEAKFWQDGVLISSDNNMAWGDVGGTVSPRSLWNYVFLGGNNYNHYAGQSGAPEQWYAIDDLVISTTYIGPDYVGSPPPSEPPGTNNLPVANSQSVSTNEDTAAPITLTATDLDGDSLSYTVLTSPGHGTLSGAAPDLLYTPVGFYSGPDSFTFNVNDTKGDSNTATVNITLKAASLPAPPPPTSDPPIKTLVSYFTFDGNANDVSGNLNNGVVNGPVLAPGKYGQAYSFSVANQSISISEAVNLDGFSQLTVSAWFKTDVFGVSTDYPMLISKSNTSGYAIGFNASGNRIWAYVNGKPLSSGGGFMSDKLGGWHHVALTYNGSEGILYVDGVNIVSAAQTGTISDNSSPLIIGNNKALDATYSGSVDDVGVYNWAFSGGQVLEVYNSTTPLQVKADSVSPSTPGIFCGPGYDVDC